MIGRLTRATAVWALFFLVGQSAIAGEASGEGPTGQQGPAGAGVAPPRGQAARPALGESPAGPGQGVGQPGVPGPGSFRSPLLTALDTDQDGVLSTEEIENAPKSLKKLDKNGDGKLTSDEMFPPRGPMGQGPGFGMPGPRAGGPGGPGAPGSGGPESAGFQSFVDKLMSNDRNGDGKVAKDEMSEPMQRSLERADTNHDGAIDRQEAEKLALEFGLRVAGRPGQGPGFGRGASRPVGGPSGAGPSGEAQSRPQEPVRSPTGE